MKLTVEVAAITSCEAMQCAYNVHTRCHAKAITVGDRLHPACDTFFYNHEHGSSYNGDSGVGACKVTGCRHNSDFGCTSDSIRVGVHGDHADCLTFERA